VEKVARLQAERFLTLPPASLLRVKALCPTSWPERKVMVPIIITPAAEVSPMCEPLKMRPSSEGSEVTMYSQTV